MTIGYKHYPQIITDDTAKWTTIAVKLIPCQVCGKDMVSRISVDTFQNDYDNRIEAQAIRAGIVLQSRWHEEKNVCIRCVTDDKVVIKCAICDIPQSVKNAREIITDREQKRFSYFCKTCFANVSAKTWYDSIQSVKDQYDLQY